tara:strand:- start:976 stop:1179 length:204 start_codon:yes stop_codon:yes gene_type:complete
MKDYHLLKQGDIVRVANYKEAEAIGIVVGIQDHGQVEVFWPMTNKTSVSGKQWAECNFELIEYENSN